MFQEHLWFLDYICGVGEALGVENTLLTSCVSCAIPSLSKEIDFEGEIQIFCCLLHFLIAFIFNSVLFYCCTVARQSGSQNINTVGPLY